MKTKIVKQECQECGKQFRVKYLEDGSYEYIDEACNCESGFHPVEDEQSISQWTDQLFQSRKENDYNNMTPWQFANKYYN